MEVRDLSLLRARDKYESRPRHRESLTKEASSPKAGDDPPFPKPSRSLPLSRPSSLPIDETETAELPLSAGESRVGRQTAREPTLQWRDWRLRFRGEGGEATLIIPQLVTARF